MLLAHFRSSAEATFDVVATTEFVLSLISQTRSATIVLLCCNWLYQEEETDVLQTVAETLDFLKISADQKDKTGAKAAEEAQSLGLLKLMAFGLAEREVVLLPEEITYVMEIPESTVQRSSFLKMCFQYAKTLVT